MLETSHTNAIEVTLVDTILKSDKHPTTLRDEKNNINYVSLVKTALLFQLGIKAILT